MESFFTKVLGCFSGAFPLVLSLGLGVGHAGLAQTQQRTPNLCAGRVIQAGVLVEGAKVHFVWMAHAELPGSLVHAIDPQPQREFVAKTKAKGAFRVSLPHRGPFAVFASKGDDLRSALLFPVSAGDYRELELVPIQRVSGTVLDAQGQPVAGAFVSQSGVVSNLVAAREKYRMPFPTTTVRSAASGAFELPVWPLGSGQRHRYRSIRAWQDGLESTASFYLNTGQFRCDATLRLTRSTTFRGQVVSADGKPVDGARVVDPVSGRAGRTDTAGRFVFEGVVAGLVYVDAPGCQLVTLRSPADGKLTARVASGARLTVRLATSRGALAGRRVIITTYEPTLGAHLPRVVKTDEAGGLSYAGLIRGRPQSAFVEVGGRFVQFLSCVPRGNVDLGTLVVDEGRTITGRVHSADRLPIEGARVYLQTDLSLIRAKNAQLRKALPKPALPGGGVSFRAGAPLFRVTYTDRAGRFRFDCVPPGAALLVVNAEAEGVQAVRLRADQGAEPLNVSMPKGVTVDGRAVDDQGQPAPFAEIQFIVSYPAKARSLGLTSCYLLFNADAAGRFRVRGVPGLVSGTSYALFAKDGLGYRSMIAGPLKSPLQHRLQPYKSRK